MSLPLGERWKLRRLEQSLTRSNSGLAARYSMFARLTRFEVMPVREQLGSWPALSWPARGRRVRKPDRLAAMLGLPPEPPAR